MKKKEDFLSLTKGRWLFKLRKMKLTAILSLLVFISFGNSYSQVNLSFSFENAGIKEVIKTIEEKTNYIFLYKDEIFDFSKKVTADFKGVKFEDVLQSFCDQTNVDFEVRDRQVILKERPAPVTRSVELQQPSRRDITGLVRDNRGLPLPGVAVVVKGTPIGAVTDNSGAFQLSIPVDAQILEFSFVGMKRQEVSVVGRSVFEIVLEDETFGVDEVVVVAFGRMAKEAFTGSAGVMRSDELIKSQVSNPAQALAGRIAGVQLSNASSQPGSSPSITIRGFSSISSGTEPLIVVDGMPYDGDLNLINANDIESMTVLKDAASNALYGARGANGVIMITTKRGSGGDARVSVDSKWGFNSNGLNNYKTTNSKQFYETYYKMLYNYYVTQPGGSMSTTDAHREANRHLVNPSTGVGPGYMVYTVPTGQDFIQPGGIMNPDATMGALYTYNDQQLWLQADDWEKEGLQNGFRQEYNVSVSGSSNRINYFSSLGYLDQEGIQEGSAQDRFTARLKMDYNAKDWLRIGGNFNYTRYNYNQISEGTIGTGTIWSIIKTMAPIYPVYYRDADRNIKIDKWGEKMYDFARSYNLSRAGGVGGNAIFSNKFRYDETYGSSFIASGFADINLTPELTLTINGNSYNYDRRYTYATSPFVDYYTDSSDNGYLAKAAYRTGTYNLQQLLNYVKQFGEHELTTLLGHEYYNYRFESLSASGYNFGIDGIYELANMLNKNSNPNSYSNEYNNEGFFFRGMYSYKQKYYGSLSFRRDATSRFIKENRWGSFWSAGGAWIISKEDFFDVSAFNSLKIKFSVGSQGNDNIGDYLYADSYNIVNNDNEVAYQWRQKGSKNITWETNINWNTGLEFELLKKRLSGSVDYFYRKTKDMLFSLNTPPSIGYTSYVTNMGDMRNAGVELVLQGTLVRTSNLQWDANFNVSHVRNKVLRLPESIKSMNVEGHEGYVNLDNSFVSKYKYFVGEGLPLYSWYLPKYAGIDPETGESLFYRNILDSEGKVTGQETTKDVNQATDYLIGDALPAFYGGFGTSLAFRGFDLSVNMNYQLGGKVYDYTYQTLMHSSGTTATTWHIDMLKAWTPENPNASVPRLQYSQTYSQNPRSDRFITKASYLNIQNINLGYTLPSNLTGRFDIDNIRIYLSGENLFYVSARQGLDPRYTLKGYTNPELYSPIRTVSGGISLIF